jgi:hypothetical protein
LAVACIGLSEELTQQLESLRIDTKRRSKWRTFRQVLKAFWDEDKILATYKRLESLRDELILRLSIITRRTTDLTALIQQEAFKKIDQQTAEIIQRLIQAPNELFASLDAQTLELASRHDESDALAIRLQQETLTAINHLKTATPAPHTTSHSLVQDNSAEKVRESLIDMLKFRQMTDRESEVAIAHHATFRWILTDQDHSQAAFSPLLPWLISADGAYWISGKAGSGKSTLMKYLGSNQVVFDALRSWANPRHLIVASFYFWRSGTVLQRSQEGLLRGLLYTILSQRPDLARTCFPDDFDRLVDGSRSITSMHPSLDLMTKAFRRLSRSDMGSSKIALLIDSVDEFEGDHTEISAFFRDLASTPSFKIVLSSRAIPACVEAFEGLPSLRLQDLTHRDIQAYVEATIGKHERMDMLLSENRYEASRLIGMILSKASGVFLWVRLVVNSLLDGFRNYDRISDLEARVNEYPTELGALYLHMFRNMEPRYQSHAARLLRIVVRSIEVQKDKALTVLQLSFADDENPSKAFSAPICPMRDEERKARFTAMVGRMRSRCCGLIEVRGSVVEVIHKSVLDFLEESDVWGTILSMTPDFDPNVALMAASLLTIKTGLPVMVNDDDPIRHYLQYCQLREKSTKKAQVRAVHELKNVLDIQRPTFAFNLFEHACLAGLSYYVDHCLQQQSPAAVKHIDIPSVLATIVGVPEQSASSRPTFSLGFPPRHASRSRSTISFPTLQVEHEHISLALITYMAESMAPTMLLRCAWLGIIDHLGSIGYYAHWRSSRNHIEEYNVLLTIIESFLHLKLDVHHTECLWASGQKSSNNKERFGNYVSRILLIWLENLSNLMVDEFDEDPELEARVETLRNEVASHQTAATQREWLEWLEDVSSNSTEELPPRIVVHDARIDPPPKSRVRAIVQLGRTRFLRLKQRADHTYSSSDMSDGPFELDSIPSKSTSNLNVLTPGQLACTPAALLGRTDLVAWHRILRNGGAVELPSSPPMKLDWPTVLRPHMDWLDWIQRYYSYSDHVLPTPSRIIVIPGVHELPVPSAVGMDVFPSPFGRGPEAGAIDFTSLFTGT